MIKIGLNKCYSLLFEPFGPGIVECPSIFVLARTGPVPPFAEILVNFDGLVGIVEFLAQFAPGVDRIVDDFKVALPFKVVGVQSAIVAQFDEVIGQLFG